MIIVGMWLSFIAIYVLCGVVGVIFAIVLVVCAWVDDFLWRRRMLGSVWAVLEDKYRALKHQREFRKMMIRRYGSS